MAYVELWQAPNGRWYFHRVAGNGRVTDSSQGYTLRRNARKAIFRRWPGIEIRFVVR